MKYYSILVAILLPILLFSKNTETWYKIKYNSNDINLKSYVQEGIIESDLNDFGNGWIKKDNYLRYSKYFDFIKVDEQKRELKTIINNNYPDTIGQVLETYILPPQVESVRGLGYDGKYFWIVDAEINDEKIHKLDPDNNFAVLNTFISPGSGSLLPWGAACDGKTIYIADALQDAIFKIDTTGNILTTLPTGGPLATGLGYRTNELWNADLGDASVFPPIPERMYKKDSLGTTLVTYNLTNAINGVAGNDSIIFVGRNRFNGEDILAMNPSNFTQLFSFPSPLQYPNGLAFDGFYLWICGNHQGQKLIVKVDVGSTNPPPQPLQFSNFALVEDGMFNNRFESKFDSQGNIHIVFATQFETASNTKDIIYATNKNGIWEAFPITNDGEINEYPVLKIDANDYVHIMWKGFTLPENDNEIFYTNNADSTGKFLPKIQITSKFDDGLDGHGRPDFEIASNGEIHFTFTDLPLAGWSEIYYAIYNNNTTSFPVNISNNGGIDSDPRILLDASNSPHIFWNNYSDGLNHATNSNGNWLSEFITDMGISRLGVVKDSQNYFHFVITNGDSVKYGSNISGNFLVDQIIAVHIASCFYPSLAIDENDILHVAYHSYGDTVNNWPGKGEIFYSNNELWEAGIFPQNISQLVNEQEIYPGIAATGNKTVFVGWSNTGVTEGVYSNIRAATTLPDSGGFFSGKINTTKDNHYFGFVPGLDSAIFSFAIYNSGISALTISNIYWDSIFDPQFSVSTDFAGIDTLDNGDSLIVNVTAFVDVPIEADTVLLDGNLVIVSDDPIEPNKNIYLTLHTEVIDNIENTSSIVYQNKLYGNYPNPFNPITNINYSIKNKSDVEIAIYNVKGQLIRILSKGEQTAGNYSIIWDGKNKNGKMQSSGIYIYRLRINNQYNVSKKMILLR